MNSAAKMAVAQAGRHCWDALVIGAGPAGAVAANRLAHLGLSTLLVDRKAFPRPKVCGACLNPRTVATLREAGLDHVLRDCHAVPLGQFLMRSAGREVLLHLPGGVALSRDTFDAALAGAAVDAGARFLPETAATVMPLKRGSGRHSSDCRTVRLTAARGETSDASARVVLAADGLGHPSLPQGEFPSRKQLGSRVGLGATFHDDSRGYHEGVIHMAVGRGGYVGLVRTEDGRLNVAAAVDPAFVKHAGGPAASIARVLCEAGFPLPTAISSASWHGTVELTQRTIHPVGHRILLLGDAAGYVEPFTGEGIAWALAAAVAVPPLAVQGLHTWSETVEHEWDRRYRQTVGHRQGWCRRLAWLLRHPQLMEVAMRLMARFPSIAQPLVRRLSTPT